MVGEKRILSDGEEESETGQKRAKMRDLQSVFGSEEKLENPRVFDGTTAMTLDSNLVEVEVTPVDLDANHAANNSASCHKSTEIAGNVTLPPLLDFGPGPVDLNARCHKPASVRKHFVQKQHDVANSGFGWDLNTEDVSSSLNPFHPYKSYQHMKQPSDALECASTTGPLEEKDPMKIWKEMKQNGFISTNHGGIPPPKPRGRKSRSDGLKKKMELAKREQVDRFAKVAAPSGLLNELNPGIINHVRNRKQVHSIMEALVRSGKDENRRAGSKQSTSMNCCSKEVDETRKDMRNGLEIYRHGLSDEHGSLSTLTQNAESKNGGNTSSIVMKRVLGKDHEDDILELKLASSVTMVSDNISSVSNEDSANLSSVSSLSVKAANIATQWLELLCQDINGRLTALRCSKKRVHSVMDTDLPFLMSKEFSSNQENGECPEEADVHQAQWRALFDQMENALSEEEKQLECWLNQVKGMRVHCERGLQYYGYTGFHEPQWIGPVKPHCRSEEADGAERELAVRAAAASIYSTCNFLLSSETLK